MALDIGVQSQVESYQRLKKWYLISPSLTLSIIRYVSREKWSNPRKGVAPFPTVAIEKGAPGWPRTEVANFTYLYFEPKKIMQYLEQTHWHVLIKMQQFCGKNKPMIDETKL